MKILRVAALDGPNVYTYRPLLTMRLDLEALTERESYELPGFVDRLLALLPGLAEHHCAKGEPGGFVERLRGGTYFGHVVEHVAIELGAGTGITGNYGKTVSAGRAGLYDVNVEYRAERAATLLLESAVDLVVALVAGETRFPHDERVREAVAIGRAGELAEGFRAVVAEAERRGIPWRRAGGGGSLLLGHGRYARLIRAPGCADARVVGDLFPEGAAARVPIVAVAGSERRGAVAALIARALERSGRVVGHATDGGLLVGGRPVRTRGAAGRDAARAALSHPEVEVAVLDMAADEILRSGLAYDWSDAAVVTDVGEERLWPDSICSREEVLEVTSLVAERVREGGTVVLDASDGLLASLPEHRRMRGHSRRVACVSTRADDPHIARHLAAGGAGYFVRDGSLVESLVGVESRIAAAARPAVRDTDVLAAAAACRALGAPLTEAATGRRR